MEQDTEQLLDQCRRTNKHLLARLDALQKREEQAREVARQCQAGSELTAKALLDANMTLERLRTDNAALLQFNSGQWLYDELSRERTKVEMFRKKHKSWADLTRRATIAKATEAQRARDLDQLVEDLRIKLVECEQQRDAAITRAEEVVGDQKCKLDRIEEQCRLWRRGELDSMTTIAGITGEFQSHPLPEPGTWDRMRALQQAQTTSLMNEMADKLSAIETLLTDEGVPLKTTQVKQVVDYIDLMRDRVKAAEEGEGDTCPE